MGTLHIFPRKLFAVLCIVFFIGAVFSVGVVFVVGGPPSSGDWVVTGIESYSDQTIVLDGNLIVERGGNLTFRRVTLKLNCAYDGQYGIEVRSGGSFYVLEGSVLTSVDPNNEYAFIVEHDSAFRMSNSELHECGWDHPGEASGLNIFSDDAVIENSLMSHNFYNVFVHSNGVVIRNNSITANEQGIKVDGRGNSSIIHGNYISSNGLGIAFAGCNVTVSGNTITSNFGSGIYFHDSIPIIRDNFITNNVGGGIRFESSRASIFNNTITSNPMDGICSFNYDGSIISENIITSNSNHGIICQDNSNAIIRNNTITGNGNGIGCENSNPTIQGNNITANWGGISCGNSNPTIQNNTLSLNQNGIAVGNSNSLMQYNTTFSPLIQYNTIFSNHANGVMVTYSNATIHQNNITANAWGIVLDHSNSSIHGNKITANYEGGIHIGDYSNGITQGNIIAENRIGIHIFINSNPTIRGNTITQNIESGIIANFNCSPLIEGNYIKNFGPGIIFKPNCTGIIQGNIIAENRRGIELHEHCSPLIQGNRVTNNYFEGILLEHYCSPTIQGNIIDHNTGNGILCEDKSSPEIHNNDIYSNTGYGVENNDPSMNINAIKNCWGSPTGPVQGPPDAGDPEEISGNIFYNPWLTESILIAEITNPLSDETVSATVMVSANVEARNDVYKVEFYIEGLQYTDFDPPYEWGWDTTQYAETSHTIGVVVYDLFGLWTKVSRTVFVDNTSPLASIKEPQSGITYCGMVTISVNVTDNKEVGNVYIIVDNGLSLLMTYNPTDFLWEYGLNTTTLYDGQHTIISLAIDRAGNPTTTLMTILTDNTSPTLTIQHPQSGITVGLTLTVMVQANDLLGVSKVEFYLHNPLPTLVSTVITVPYQWAWDTTKYPNGVYTITVKAYDTIGNAKTRDITVIVNNVEVPWLQANLLTIVQVTIGLGGLVLAIVTYWSRTKDKRKKKKTTKKKEKTNVPPKKDTGKQD